MTIKEDIAFQGTFFDGKTSKANSVTVCVCRDTISISDNLGTSVIDFPISHCTIVPPLGQEKRSLNFKNGSQCDTNDLGAISSLEKRLGVNRGLRLVNTLESRWKPVVGCFVCLIICVWAFTKYGIPYVAEKTAYTISPELTEKLSQKTLEILDERYLLPSELEPQRTAEVRTIFNRIQNEMDQEFNFRLELRRGDSIGPNAFALPSGLILMTDELVLLAESDRELAGVFSHELAHVEKRHGMRSILQNTGVFLIVSILVGDVTSITSTAATLPVLLAESGYSRNFEKEADREAGLYCIKKGWSTKPYRDILMRLTRDSMNFPGRSFLSTHPETQLRVTNLLLLEESIAEEGQKNF